MNEDEIIDEIIPGNPSWYEAKIARLRERLDNYVATIGRENIQLEEANERLRALLKRAAPYIDYCTGGSAAAKDVLREIDALEIANIGGE